MNIVALIIHGLGNVVNQLHCPNTEHNITQ